MLNRPTYWAALGAALLSPNLAAANSIPFDDARWTINAEEQRLQTYKGEDALFISNGSAILTDADFKDGTIEFKLLMPNPSRGFSGIIFRVQEDGQTFEDFYMRPHLSGKPDANQYTPVFGGATGWQIYFGPHYSAPIPYKYDQWQHVKLVVSGDQAEVYVDSDEPVLFIDDLKGDFDAGRLGVRSYYAPAYFASFSYVSEDSPDLAGKPLDKEVLPDHLISTWQISQPFERDALIQNNGLNNDVLGGNWTSLKVETNGIANIAKAAKFDRTDNTVYARVTVRSDTAQTKKLRFGYSDTATVFVNARPQYSGSNLYMSRDYRYLGTVGLFDEVHVNLREGDNHIYIAVSENFGGWAVMGAFEDMNGITLVE